MKDLTAPAIVLLDAARKKLIADGWTQGKIARDSNGNFVNPTSPRAVAFCAIGALEAAWYERGAREGECAQAQAFLTRAISKLKNGAPVGSISTWNDTTGRTKTEVLTAFNLALQIADER